MAPYNAQLGRRDDAGSTDEKKPLPVFAIIGFGIAGLLLIIVLVWVAVALWRKRQKKKREDSRGAAFLTVKGLVKERDSFWSAGALPADLQGFQHQKSTKSSNFSRANLTQSVVMPDKCIVRPDATREEIIAHHEAEGTLPRPFAPFSFAMAINPTANTLVPPSSPHDTLAAHSKAGATIGSAVSPDRESQYSGTTNANILPSPATYVPRGAKHHSTQRSSIFSALRDSVRDSFFTANNGAPGFAFGGAGARASARFSFASTSSSLRSTGVGMQVRRVRQTFTPILPDEPLLSLSERVTVMQAFDDGWCVIGRDAPYGKPGEIELGTVPAWCFVKPMKGLRSERPVRSASLGVTLQMEMEVPEKRDDIISWSNF